MLLKALKRSLSNSRYIFNYEDCSAEYYFQGKNHGTLNYYIFTLLSVEVFKIHCCL